MKKFIFLILLLVGCTEESYVTQDSLLGSWVVVRVDMSTQTILYPEGSHYNYRKFYIDGEQHFRVSHSPSINNYVYLEGNTLDEFYFNPSTQEYGSVIWTILKFKGDKMVLINGNNSSKEWTFKKQ